MLSPFKGRFRVTQLFKGSLHDGLDLVGIDSKVVYSTVDGVVEKAGWEDILDRKKGFGLYVRIKQNGSTDKYYFGHLSSIKVKVGDRVNVGTPIGIEGNTGYSFGSHCHYCVRGNGSKSQIRDICAISGIPNILGTYESDLLKEAPTDIFYCVCTGGKWLPVVKNLEDYAGIKGKAVTDIAVKSGGGNIKYRVHLYKGGWLPYVTGFDTTDIKNGYAGNGKPIDAVEIILEGLSYKAVSYRVSPVNGSYYSWQKNNQKSSTQDGYAGLFGKKIDRLQMKITNV